MKTPPFRTFKVAAQMPTQSANGASIPTEEQTEN